MTALSSLYPHWHRSRLMMAVSTPRCAKPCSPSAATASRSSRASSTTHADDVLRAAHLLADSYRGGGRLYTMGNGGSSCDAAHIAVEFQHPVTAGRPALPAQNLAQDMAMISAVGNDVGFGEVFARQMPGLLRRGDIALGVSTSGNSANVLRGLEVARSLGARTLALAGGAGGEMARAGYIDLCLVVGSDSIHRVQETHVAIYHVLWDLVHSLLADDRGARSAA